MEGLNEAVGCISQGSWFQLPTKGAVAARLYGVVEEICGREGGMKEKREGFTSMLHGYEYDTTQCVLIYTK